MPQAGIDPRSGNSCPGCGWSEGGGGYYGMELLPGGFDGPGIGT